MFALSNQIQDKVASLCFTLEQKKKRSFILTVKHKTESRSIIRIWNKSHSAVQVDHNDRRFNTFNLHNYFLSQILTNLNNFKGKKDQHL
jgi:hypothetical protein